MTSLLHRAILASGLFVVAVSPLPANELSGTVKNVCGLAIPGASVSLVNRSVAPVLEDGSAHPVGSVAGRNMQTGGGGNYSFTGLAPGQWTVTVALVGFKTHEEDVRLPQDGDAVQLNVRLLPDLFMKQELVITHGDPNLRYRRYSVHGVVRTNTGEPVSAASVRLQDVGPKRSLGTLPCTTDELGRYAISAWSVETKWQLTVDADGFRSYTHPALTLVPDEPRALDLPLVRLKP